MDNDKQRIAIGASALKLNSKPIPKDCTVIHEVTILYEGWEADNKAVVIKGPDGIFAVGTSHGRPHLISAESLVKIKVEHETALFSINKAIKLLMPISQDITASKTFKEGFADCEKWCLYGFKRPINPYSKENPDHQLWQDGYDEAWGAF